MASTGRKFERLRALIPSLYRPDDDQDDSLLRQFLEALGESMDTAGLQLTHTMQSHWFELADKASFDAHALCDRSVRKLPPFNVRDAADQLEMLQYPYVTDLARIGNLVAVEPWREPAALRDNVENYRRRIANIIAIYREGLGTLSALRRMVEAELPLTLELPLTQRARSFALEERVDITNSKTDVTMNGVPADLVGPMMRWSLQRTGTEATTPVIYISGVAPVAGEIDATVNPLIEHFDPAANGLIGVGLAWRGTLDDGEVLRIKSARTSLVVTAEGIAQSAVVTDASSGSDPSVNGPWATIAGAPAIAITVMVQTTDKAIWIAGDQQLWRFDGSQWRRFFEAETLPQITSLCEFDQQLFIGSANGLQYFALYAQTVVLNAVAGVNGVAINRITVLKNNKLWLATANGPRRVLIGEDDSVTVQNALFDRATFAICDSGTDRLFACESGLLRQDRVRNVWYAYVGEKEGELTPEWQRIEAGALPAAETLFLPPVTDIAIAADRSLWLATPVGLARYYARERGDLVFKTVLEAFPDLITGAVTQLLVDERGMLYVAAANGWFRYDGRDIAQFDSAVQCWLQLGEAASIYTNDIAPESRGAWRYDRARARWQQFDYRGQRFADSALALRALNQPAVTQFLFAPSIVAHLGSGTGAAFAASTAVPLTDFVMRVKPAERVILTGGLVAIPELPAGISTWRYLQLEPEVVTVPADLPWWSPEGRLVPPPEHAAVYPGRYRSDASQPDGRFDESVYAYNPCAHVAMHYLSGPAVTVQVRLFMRNADDHIDPAIIDRVWAGINQVKPAGVPVLLSVEGSLVKGA